MKTDSESIDGHLSGFPGRSGARTMVAILIFAGVVTAFAIVFTYRSHLLYYFCTNTMTREKQVNVAAMPVGSNDEEFAVCRVGQLEFLLPHELANSMVRGPAELENHKIYGAGNLRVHVIAPAPPPRLSELSIVTDPISLSE
jgi:hypothetical protein